MPHIYWLKYIYLYIIYTGVSHSGETEKSLSIRHVTTFNKVRFIYTTM